MKIMNKPGIKEKAAAGIIINDLTVTGLGREDFKNINVEQTL